MLSLRHVRMIEDHWETIHSQVIRRIRNDQKLSHLGRLPESELQEWGQEILKYLGRWLAESSETEIARRYEHLGQVRFREDIPLHEAVHGLNILKSRAIEYIRNQGLSEGAVEIYAEEELEHELNRFFDTLAYYLVRGYEGALRTAAHL